MNTPLSRQMDQMADAQEWKDRAEAAAAELVVYRETILGLEAKLAEALDALNEARGRTLKAEAEAAACDGHGAREWDATRVSGPALFARDIDSLAALLAEVASETRRKTLDEPAEPSSERDAAVILAESLGYNVVKFPMVTQIMRQHIGGERDRMLAEVRRVVAEVGLRYSRETADEILARLDNL